MSNGQADLRRYQRVRVAWRIAIEGLGNRPRTHETVDLSPFGVKVRLDQRLPEGWRARLRLLVPDRRPLQVNAIVWRTDPEGPVFVFVGVGEEELARMKFLVDSHRSP